VKKKALFAIAFLLLVAGGVYMTARERPSEWRPGEPIDAARVKVGVIYPTDPTAETSGYAYAHYDGVREMQSSLGLSDSQILNKTNIPDADQSVIESSMRECVARGANIIIATSWGFMDACEKLSAEYPRVVFAHATGYKYNDVNFTNYFGRMYQARYLGGIAAGLRTRSDKIGFVAAMGRENSEVTGGINAFAMGVESVNPEARIYVKVTHNWFDPAGEALAARDMISYGCDVIAQHCNNSNPQVEAQAAGVWSIGFNSDMSGDAPDAVITSVIWRWGVYYKYLVKSVIDGTLRRSPI
jgi:basic membrane protein A